MITVEQVQSYLGKDPDIQRTEDLKKLLRIRREQGTFYLSNELFEGITQWKLRSQYGRVQHLLEKNTPERIESTSRLAFDPILDGVPWEVDVRFSILTSLDGVGTGVASAILALSYPERFCVIDFRGWLQVFDQKKKEFDLRKYKRYLDAIRTIATRLNVTPQEVDLAIWAYDKTRTGDR